MAKVLFSIFFTADIHGRDVQSAKLFSAYKRERKKAEKQGRLCLFLDSGDSSDRCNDYCSLTKCRSYGHILNEFAYDAQTVGNDIGLVYGPQALIEALKEIRHPVLGANFRDGKGPLLEGLQEHSLIEFSNIKVGIFGLTNPWGTAYESFGFHFPPAEKCAADQVKALKNKGADIIIFLSHMGISDELHLTFHLKDINFVIGGHSHSLSPGGLINHNGTMFHHCGSYAENLGRIDFEYDDIENKVLQSKSTLYAIKEEEKPAEEILDAISKARKDAAIIGDRIIGETEFNLSLDYQNECTLGNFAADALRNYLKSDIAFLAGGHLSCEIIKGQITMTDLSRAFFSTANPCFSLMTGQAIRKSLEKGLDDELRNLFHHGLRGAPIGIPQISGLKVEADMTLPSGNRIKSISIAGIPYDENKKYSIAHTDLEIHKSLGYFPSEGYDHQKTENDVIIGDVLIDYLTKYPEIKMNDKHRWHFS